MPNVAVFKRQPAPRLGSQKFHPPRIATGSEKSQRLAHKLARKTVCHSTHSKKACSRLLRLGMGWFGFNHRNLPPRILERQSWPPYKHQRTYWGNKYCTEFGKTRRKSFSTSRQFHHFLVPQKTRRKKVTLHLSHKTIPHLVPRKKEFNWMFSW